MAVLEVVVTVVFRTMEIKTHLQAIPARTPPAPRNAVGQQRMERLTDGASQDEIAQCALDLSRPEMHRI